MKITFRAITILVFIFCNNPLYARLAMHIDPLLFFDQNLQIISQRCVKILKKQGREILLNKCNACRSVALTRRRSGIPTPVVRRYKMPPNTQFPIPFRGPGQTRLSNDIACAPPLPKRKTPSNRIKKNIEKPQSTCVSLKRISNGVVLLVNSCKICKKVIIQRMHANGQSLSQELLKLKPLKSAIIQPKGGTQVKITHAAKC